MLGIAIALAQQGLLPLHVGMAFVLGANVGTTAAPLFAALSKGPAPLRFSAAYVLFKATIALAVLPFLHLLTPALQQLSGEEASVSTLIANGHTALNLALALVFFPLLGPVASAVTALVPAAVKAE